MQRRQFMLAAAAAASAALPIHAQTYPARPVKIIVPLPPGSPPDVLGRILAEKLSEAWKQSVVVENRPGATGMIGMDAVAKAPADGYTVGIMFLTHTVLPALFGKVPYDTVGSFAPIANLAWIYNVLVVPTATPVQNLKEYIEAARAQPGKITFGSGGNGSPAHLIGESFKAGTKLELQHVPFKGPAEAVQGLLGGHVSSMFATTSVAVPQVKAGRLRALAVTSPTRLAALPEVSTLAELGVTGVQMHEWEGVVAPAGTPADVLAHWNREVTRVMALPDVREKIAVLGMVSAAPNGETEFGTLIRNELAYWTQFVKANGLKAD